MYLFVYLFIFFLYVLLYVVIYLFIHIYAHSWRSLFPANPQPAQFFNLNCWSTNRNAIRRLALHKNAWIQQANSNQSGKEFLNQWVCIRIKSITRSISEGLCKCGSAMIFKKIWFCTMFEFGRFCWKCFVIGVICNFLKVDFSQEFVIHIFWWQCRPVRRTMFGLKSNYVSCQESADGRCSGIGIVRIVIPSGTRPTHLFKDLI